MADILAAVNKTANKIGNVIGIVIGVLFIVFAVKALTAPKVDYLETEGRITNIIETYRGYDFDTNTDEYDHTVEIVYTVEGKEYSGEYGSYKSSMKIGDTVTVLYDPADPTHIQAPGFGVIPYVLLGLGVLVIGFCSWRFIRSRRLAY